ncbi:MAG TPA: dipeptidase, partial [Gemmatimonadaceae bacterium]|nr:dipeptidase [Gemmatimonadaceae bacterium]
MTAVDSTVPAYLPDVSPRAMRIWREAIVIDMHNDMPSKMADDGYDPAVRHAAGFDATEGHTDLPRLVESGLTAVFLSAWVDAPYAQRTPDRSFARAIELADTITSFANRHPGQLLFATNAADVRRAKREGKVAILIGVEGGHAIENSLDKLRELQRRGVRYMTLTWNNGNSWAGSCCGLNGTRTGGLTPFGRDVIREMNRLGILVDISHVSDSTFYDAVATSTKPVIASHSSARALNEHPRNLTDDELRAVARNGGVVNVNFFSLFIDPVYREARTRADADLRRLRDSIGRSGTDSSSGYRAYTGIAAQRYAAIAQTPLKVLIDHIDHIAKVAGVDHVGLGSDFDGVSALPTGMDDITRLPRIVQSLLDRGYSETDIKKIVGGNMLR